MSAISAADVNDQNQTLVLDSSSDISSVSADDADETTETDNLAGEFTVEDGLGPGMWEIVLKSDGTDDFTPCESRIRVPILPITGSRIILDEFNPDWTKDGEITLEYMKQWIRL